MPYRKRLIIAGLIALVLVSSGILVGPALWPGLDLARWIPGEDDTATVKAQDTSEPSSSSEPGCYYLESGAVRTIFHDGAELIKFPDGHIINIEAPLLRSDRSVVTEYEDGTVRLQTFKVGTLTRQMSIRQPLKTRWFKPSGDLRPAPEPGTYPELWDVLRSDISPLGPEHPWGEDWETLEPPGWNRPDQDIFGPVRKVREREGEVWTWFADGTVKQGIGSNVVYGNRGRHILLAEYDDGPPLYLYFGEDEGFQVACPSQVDNVAEDYVRLVKGKYPDGTIRRFYIPSGTDLTRLTEAKRYCEVWERGGKKIEPQDEGKYPLKNMPEGYDSPPPELFE